MYLRRYFFNFLINRIIRVGYEIGDLCEHDYGQYNNGKGTVRSTTVNGKTSYYNVILKGRKYLLEKIFKKNTKGRTADGGLCYMTLPPKPK